MAKVPAQTTTVMNADLAALNGQLTVLRGIRNAIPAEVNPREIQLLDKQIKQLDAVTVTLKHRIARAA